MPRWFRYGFLALSGLAAAFPSLLAAQTASNFIPVTPCRVVDTRGAVGALTGPSLAANVNRTFPVPSSSCGIPANASGYSLNVTVVPKGQLGTLVLWGTGQPEPGATTVIFYNAYVNNAAIVPAGTGGAIDVAVNAPTDVILDINGYFLPVPPTPASPTPPTPPPPLDASNPTAQSTSLGTGASLAGAQNTALGFNTLNTNSTGNGNTAAGAAVLSSNTSGNNNVGLGASALSFNSTGSANTAAGTQALLNNLIGNNNTAAGYNALWSNAVGSNNSALGSGALFNDTSGGSNTALGENALYANTDGSWNIAVGFEAGNQISTGSYNIDIGNQGSATDSNITRIGTTGNQTSAFIAGVYGVNVLSGSTVLINANGQIGTSLSSERYKEDIHDMQNASDNLLRLRPVTFRYKQAAEDGAKPLQYGLVAEEVAKVYPDLVVYNLDGTAETVEYQELPALLLNELQKQHKTIDEQEKLIDSLTKRLATIEALLANQSASAANVTR